jgi:hypothetical protein
MMRNSVLQLLLSSALFYTFSVAVADCVHRPGAGAPPEIAGLFKAAYDRNGGEDELGCAHEIVHDLDGVHMLQDFTNNANEEGDYKHRSVIIFREGAEKAYLLHGSVLFGYWDNDWKNLSLWGEPVCDVLDVLKNTGQNSPRIAEFGLFSNADVYYRYDVGNVILVEEPVREYYRSAYAHLGPAGLPAASPETGNDGCVRQRFQYNTLDCHGRYATHDAERLALAKSAADYLLANQYHGPGNGKGLFNNISPNDGFTYIVPREHGIVIVALAELYMWTGDERYYDAALDAADALIRLQISDGSDLNGGFYKQYALDDQDGNLGNLIDPPTCDEAPCDERRVSPGYVSQVLVGFEALRIELLPDYKERVWGFTKKAADFLVKLVKTSGDSTQPSGGIYGGYEEKKLGVHTLNLNLYPNDHASAARALDYSAYVAELNGNDDSKQTYQTAANGIRKVLNENLFDEQNGRWHQRIGDDGRPDNPLPGLDAWIALYWEEGGEHAAEVLDWMKRDLRHANGAIGMNNDRDTTRSCTEDGWFYCAVAGQTVKANKLFDLYGDGDDAELGRAWFEKHSGMLCPEGHDCPGGTHTEWVFLDPQKTVNLCDRLAIPRVSPPYQRYIDGQAYWILDVLRHRFNSFEKYRSNKIPLKALYSLQALPSRGGWRSILQ